ncbi:hypothetical protein Aspvir_007048 [Aspergillus viridinutans]|uniref:Uncharacterized protein n=1 Tax=Aspergillus viridinutans TaxID=75553 RepID=A0A9P3F2K9_ASPVI|nr:uncharacterized protein Aspvir_007048 [Aspergillus viridinutans]GIK02982.1 hypothetical protein Aspvir_007048 [Aspergillus viridinutans]
MLIEAICEQSGYNGDDEGEVRDPKNPDIVFLDQETRLSLLVKVDNIVRNLNGKVDFAVWHEGDKNGMGTNLVALEAKRLGDECLCYMNVSQQRAELGWRQRDHMGLNHPCGRAGAGPAPMRTPVVTKERCRTPKEKWFGKQKRKSTEFEDHRAKDRDLWAEVGRVAKTARETAKRTADWDKRGLRELDEDILEKPKLLDTWTTT